MKRCDVIIPIYNAYEYLQKCLESVVRNTDLRTHGLILVEDKSPDENIIPYLENFVEENKELNITLIQNEQNLGFVANVNKGMKYSSNDVLLLNSDTEVPENWLDNIINCGYSQEMVATVTTLSNNATLVSTPVGLQPNDLPTNMTFDEYAKVVEESSFVDYPILPSSHGFCMFIKREVLDIVGYFDEEAFGRGYGEENDFSYRCLDYGYKHLLCDNVIVYHKESQSFNEDKKELIENNLEILKKRYPMYVEKLETWLKRFPIQYICKNISYNIEMKDRENILFVVHDWKDAKNNLGGTTLHCYDLIQNLRDKYNFHVFAPEDGLYKVYSYFKDKEEILTFDGIYSTGIINTYNQEYKSLVKKVISGLHIDVMHIHHMLGHYFDIIDIAKENGIKSYITLHDFYSLCPSINMLYQMKEYCLPLKNKDCASCLKNKMGISNDIIDNWQAQWKQFLSKFTEIITPSLSTKEIIEKELKEVHCKVMEHGIDIRKELSSLQIDNEVFNVAFIGVMAIHKGAKTLEYLIKNTKNKKIKYHLFGVSELESLLHSKGNYEYHGKYKREDLPRLLQQNNIHLVCNLSIWPETYSYTLTETIACGVPVLGYDLGAVGERIQKYGFGWIIPLQIGDKAIVQKIDDIYQDKSEYDKAVKSINEYHIKNVSEMIEEYVVIYSYKSDENFEYTNLRTLISMDNRNKMVGSSSELDQILNSRRWKLVSKVKVPEFAKKIVRKIIK